jgi:hypothetical protein
LLFRLGALAANFFFGIRVVKLGAGAFALWLAALGREIFFID